MEHGNKQRLNLVVDLDGTFSSVNTFKVFCVVLFIYTLFSLQLKRFFEIVFAVKQRLTKKIDRWSMKREFGMIFYALRNSDVFLSLFIWVLVPTLRKRIVETIKGNNLILASAAFEFYSSIISKKYAFNDVIATTRIDIENDIESIGELKKNRVLKLIGENNQVDVFLTDHYDDIPLIEHSRLTILVKPSKSSIEKIFEKQDKAKIQICNNSNELILAIRNALDIKN